MKKCIIIGEEGEEVKSIKLTPIVFERSLSASFNINKYINTNPNSFDYLELICKNYNQEQGDKKRDLIFAYNDIRSEGILYIGKWNDGIV